ncbi:MAG: glycosyltransferase family 39 protein [Acidobacteriaceae bacterium]|nr:glycosyltransferase family 39 protein [Acidobacteriaceae bacterium]
MPRQPTTQPKRGRQQKAAATPKTTSTKVAGRPTERPSLSAWSPARAYLVLAALTLICLLPFSGRAFQIDEPLFIWVGQQITKHPLDPYGFRVVWNLADQPMSGVASNPPLSSYYIALVGLIAGWSERAMHLAYLLPALVVVLGTYRLAQRFTRLPLLASAIALLTPVFLVSSSTVMCDTTMVAFWMVGTILWIEGLDAMKPMYLIGSVIALGACVFTKYFGIFSFLFLIVYSLARKRRLLPWGWYLSIPAAMFVGYVFWTRGLYGYRLLFSIAGFALSSQAHSHLSLLGKALVGLSFAGGCVLPALLYAPLLWSRLQLTIAALALALLSFFAVEDWLYLGYTGREHLALVCVEAGFFAAGGLSLAALALLEPIRRRQLEPAQLRRWHFWVTGEFLKQWDAESLFLAVWILGTLIFASLINWTNNGRSILPLVPAAAILIARNLEKLQASFESTLLMKRVAPLALSGVLSLCVAWGDTSLANLQRSTAQLIHEKMQNEPGKLWFEGHWGFQYYMQAFGAAPIRPGNDIYRPGDLIAVPQHNTRTFQIPPSMLQRREVIVKEPSSWVSTVNVELGAGFYASVLGPLPFVFGPIPPEHFYIYEVTHPFGLRP